MKTKSFIMMSVMSAMLFLSGCDSPALVKSKSNVSFDPEKPELAASIDGVKLTRFWVKAYDPDYDQLRSHAIYVMEGKNIVTESNTKLIHKKQVKDTSAYILPPEASKDDIIQMADKIKSDEAKEYARLKLKFDVK